MSLLKLAKSLNEKYYYTGKPCKNGHLSVRVVCNRTCLQCALEATKEWRRDNFDYIKEYSLNYHRSNPLIKRTSENNRRALKLNSGGTFTRQDVIYLYEVQDGKCTICNCDLSGGYHLDHIIPLSRGGSNSLDNLQLLCPTDNIRKNTKTHSEYLACLK